jgi:hypothetical protein
VTDVDGMIRNARAGACMCGRTDGVLYGPHPFGYGPCCVFCQREWSRQHDGARWVSDAERLCWLNAECARARADGRDEREVVDDWNRSRGRFAKPAQTTTKLSAIWRREYAAWADVPDVPDVPDDPSPPADFTTPVDPDDIPF